MTMKTIATSIATLAASPRGNKILAALAEAQASLNGADSGNLAAFATLTAVAASGEFNGTLTDALAPYAAAAKS